MTRYNPNPAYPLYSLYIMYAEVTGYLDLKWRCLYCTGRTEKGPGSNSEQHRTTHIINVSLYLQLFLAATAGLANGLGLLLEQLRVLEAAQRSRFSPEQFLKLAANGNDKLVSQMVKGEPDLVNTLNYFCSDWLIGVLR